MPVLLYLPLKEQSISLLQYKKLSPNLTRFWDTQNLIAPSILAKWMGAEECVQEVFCRTSPNSLMWFLVPRLAVALILQCLHLRLISNMQLSALS